MFNRFAFASSLMAPVIGMATPAQAAGGDLLVAPTRVVLDGSRGTELILNNIGQEVATYRISLELKRMTPEGQLEDITPEKATPREKAALAMISYAPRRVVLPPNQPQSVRVGVRMPAGLADGEYRAHMLFRAIPSAAPPQPVSAEPAKGITIALNPIYGITIPIIVRRGSLSATATISDPKLIKTPEGPAFFFKLTRNGTRSVYGRLRVTKPGQSKPVYEARGIAIYPELTERSVQLLVSPEVAAQLSGPVKIEYLEDTDAGGGTISAIQAVIR